MRSVNLLSTVPRFSSASLCLCWEKVIRCLPYLDLTTPRATYVMRSLLAACLALVLAYWLDIDAPYSAASSVLLVINPVQGAVIGKGVWRVIGTLIGMLAAFILIAEFGQMPWLFMLGFGFWLGLCVMGMTLLRHFRAYGATLAGYTVGLATYGAMQHPELAFDQIMGRGTSVLIGVMSLAVVSTLFSARSISARLQTQLHRLASATAEILATNLSVLHCKGDGGNNPLDAGRLRLIVEIYGVDDLLAQGKAESTDLAQRAATVRHAMVSLFSALVSGAPMWQYTANLWALRAFQPTWEQTWLHVSHVLKDPADAAGVERAVQLLSELRVQLLATFTEHIPNDESEYAALVIVGEQLLEQLDDYLEALKGISRFHQWRPIATSISVPFSRDKSAALQNGLRALLTVVLGGAFWIVTGWSYGNLMLAGLAASCALLSTAPNPALGAVEFIKGTVIAVVMAFICTFLVLPYVSGLPLLLVILGLFWLPGIYATTLPRYGLAGVTYLVAFTTLAATDNPMHYDFPLFLNGAVAWILATSFALLGFQIILPRNLSRDVARLRLTIRDDTLAILKGKRTIGASAWQWRQQHRTAQLGALLKTQPELMALDVANAMGSIHLGRELLRLRHWLQQTALESELRHLITTAWRYISRRAAEPELAAKHARRAAKSLSRLLSQENSALDEGKRLVIVFLNIATLLENHANYFTQRPGVHANAE